MALRVWLPLNGGLENKGISNITVTNNGATVNDSGKIGKCYSFNGSNNWIKLEPALFTNSTQEFSVCCWFKTNSVTSAECLFSQRNACNANGFSVFVYGTSGRVLIDDGVRWDVTPRTLVADTWYHLTFTRSQSGKAYYINGELVASTTTKGTPTTAETTSFMAFGSGHSSATGVNVNWVNGYINDWRLYDHCLSAKEVKEISQGLILHYKLDGFSGGVGDNILTGTATQTILIANSSTTTNATGKWGTANGGNGTHSIINIENDTPVSGVNWGFKITNNTSGNKDFCQHNQPYVNGVTYTVSWYMRGQGTYLVRQWNIIDGKQMQSKTGAVNTTEWTYYTWTFTANEELETDVCSLHLGATGNTPSLEWCAMKMEVGSIATPWTPSLSEMGINTTRIVDSSGYGNYSYPYNIYFISEQGPRYNVMADFSEAGNSSSAELSTSKGNTIAFWCSASDWSEYNLDAGICQGSNWCITSHDNNLILELVSHRSAENSDYNLSQAYSWTLMPTSSLSADWHYFVLTYLNHEIKFYLDGILYQTISNISTDIADYFYTNYLSLASLPVA